MRYLVLLPLLLTAACTSDSGNPAIPLPGSGNFEVEENYPEGPYTLTRPGGIIEPLAFEGYVRPAEGIGPERRVTIELADLYNPSGHDAYGADSPFGEGNPKPRALVVNVAGVWCTACKREAELMLPVEYAKLHPLGLELLTVLADTETPGEIATIEELDAWIKTFDSTYPSVIDPAYRIASPFGQAMPVNILVDLRTMTIVDEPIIGIPLASFWTGVEAKLAP